MQLEQCGPKIPVVILGEDKTLSVKLVNKSSPTKDPIDISAASEIVAVLLNADGSFLEKKLSLSGIVIISGPGGHFQIILTAAETTLLKPSPDGSYSDIRIDLTIGGLLTIIPLLQSVSLVERIFPTAP